jgi:hypothetical protein
MYANQLGRRGQIRRARELPVALKYISVEHKRTGKQESHAIRYVIGGARCLQNINST